MKWILNMTHFPSCAAAQYCPAEPLPAIELFAPRRAGGPLSGTARGRDAVASGGQYQLWFSDVLQVVEPTLVVLVAALTHWPLPWFLNRIVPSFQWVT